MKMKRAACSARNAGPSRASRQEGAQLSVEEPDSYEAFSCAACMRIRGTSTHPTDEKEAVIEAADTKQTVQCKACEVCVHGHCYGISKDAMTGKYYVHDIISICTNICMNVRSREEGSTWD